MTPWPRFRWHKRRRRERCKSNSLARIPAKRNRFADKDSRQINMLEQILIAKVFNFGGICSRSAFLRHIGRRVEQAMQMHDEIPHLSIVDRLARLGEPSLLRQLEIWEDADDIKIGDVLE